MISRAPRRATASTGSSCSPTPGQHSIELAPQSLARDYLRHAGVPPMLRLVRTKRRLRPHHVPPVSGTAPRTTVGLRSLGSPRDLTATGCAQSASALRSCRPTPNSGTSAGRGVAGIRRSSSERDIYAASDTVADHSSNGIGRVRSAVAQTEPPQARRRVGTAPSGRWFCPTGLLDHAPKERRDVLVVEPERRERGEDAGMSRHGDRGVGLFLEHHTSAGIEQEPVLDARGSNDQLIVRSIASERLHLPSARYARTAAPWDEWSAEFRARLPEPIVEMMERLLSQSTDDNNPEEAIRQRLKRIEELMRHTKYRRNPAGTVKTAGDALGDSPGESDTEPSERRNRPGSDGGRLADLYGAYVDEDEESPRIPSHRRSTSPPSGGSRSQRELARPTTTLRTAPPPTSTAIRTSSWSTRTSGSTPTSSDTSYGGMRATPGSRRPSHL